MVEVCIKHKFYGKDNSEKKEKAVRKYRDYIKGVKLGGLVD